jgi:hypothetical protein
MAERSQRAPVRAGRACRDRPGANFHVIVLVDAAAFQARKTRWIPSAEALGCA